MCIRDSFHFIYFVRAHSVRFHLSSDSVRVREPRSRSHAGRTSSAQRRHSWCITRETSHRDDPGSVLYKQQAVSCHPTHADGS
eukprot:1857888-Prymnesium_polylepis.1